MQLFKELQRRNVFRVAIAYALSSWLLAQVADLVLDNINAPEWVMQTILLVLVLVLVLALGFPVVVFFSPVLKGTPEYPALINKFELWQENQRKIYRSTEND